MSRAFVKEAEGEGWTAPAEQLEFVVLHRSRSRSDAAREVFQHADLLEALRWAQQEQRPPLELRRRTEFGGSGGVLAWVDGAEEEIGDRKQ